MMEEEEQLLLPLEHEDDTWFVPENEMEAVIVFVNQRYYLWQNGKELMELIPTPILVDDTI